MPKEIFETSFVAAIVLGSSKVTGIVGRKEPEGTISVLSHVAIPSTDFISKGRVFNAEKMISSLKTIRERLEENINRKIDKAYLSIDCMGIRSMPNIIEKIYNERVTMTQEFVNQFLHSNRENKTADRTFIETIPLEYKLGTITTTDPIGVMTDSVKAHFLNIVCNTTVIETIENCFRKAGITIVRHTIAATQLAQTVTNEQERTSGCVFVDMGSETTTVAIYKGKLLRHLAVIPLGGANITRDIANVFNCEEAEAEQLKRNAGFPNFEDLEENGKEPIFLRDGGRKRLQSELAEIIEARVEEIVQNIKHQIDFSGFNRENLVNGLYIIGGGAQLKNINKSFEQHFKDWNIRFSKTPSRLGNVSCIERNFNENGTFNVALSIVENGDINCNGGARDNQEWELFDGEEQENNDIPPLDDNAEANADAEAKDQEQTESASKKSGKLSVFLNRLKNTVSDFVSDGD